MPTCHPPKTRGTHAVFGRKEGGHVSSRRGIFAELIGCWVAENAVRIHLEVQTWKGREQRANVIIRPRMHGEDRDAFNF